MARGARRALPRSDRSPGGGGSYRALARGVLRAGARVAPPRRPGRAGGMDARGDPAPLRRHGHGAVAHGARVGTRPGGGLGRRGRAVSRPRRPPLPDRKSTRLNSSHGYISYAVFCLKKKKKKNKVKSHIRYTITIETRASDLST